MRITLPSSFRMRVAAVTEAEAADFLVRRILPRYHASDGNGLRPMLWGEEPFDGFDHFEKIDSWMWSDALSRLEQVAAKGFNALVLNDSFMNWTTEKEAINEDLLAFENALTGYGIALFNIETHSTGNLRSIQKHQRLNADWPEVALDELLSVMQDGYEEGELVAPWGALPYLLLYPQLPDEEQEPGRKVVAGFQVQQYKAVLERWPDAKGPWWHLTEIKEGVDCAKSGPIPMRVI